MQKYMIIYFIFVLIIIIFLCTISFLIRDKLDFISINNFPKLPIILNNKSIILNEMNEYSKARRWVQYNDEFINNYNNYDDKTVHDYLQSKNTYINIGLPSWKVFWLKVNKLMVDQNLFFCPKTTNLLLELDKISDTDEHKIINAGMMSIEPGYIGESIGKNDNLIRCYIPLFIPDGDSGIEIQNKKYKWSDMLDPIIISNKLQHKMWNYTNASIVILTIYFSYI